MILFIRNMVCTRCIMAVNGVFESEGLAVEHVELGEVSLKSPISAAAVKKIASKLEALGFEILDNKKQKLIELIKTALTKKVQSGSIEEHFSLSRFISAKLAKDYQQASRLFSEVEGITIEQFFLLQKIEKVKEWLVYDELSLGEVAWKLGYSSVAHLSAQFKKITGMTPSYFREQDRTRRPIDKISSSPSPRRSHT